MFTYFHPNNLPQFQCRISIIFLHHNEEKNYPEEINLPHNRINRQLQNHIWITYRLETNLIYLSASGWKSSIHGNNSSTFRNNSRPPNATGPIKVVLNKCLVQQKVIQVQIKLALKMTSDLSKEC